MDDQKSRGEHICSPRAKKESAQRKVHKAFSFKEMVLYRYRTLYSSLTHLAQVNTSHKSILHNPLSTTHSLVSFTEVQQIAKGTYSHCEPCGSTQYTTFANTKEQSHALINCTAFMSCGLLRKLWTSLKRVDLWPYSIRFELGVQWCTCISRPRET